MVIKIEFNEKLQKLRSDKNWTQEELAEQLFVSRTAISKWESGRGLPNIESLKAISKVFSVSIDDLLSSEELIQAAEEDKKESETSMRSILYGLLDVLNLVFFLLPLFGMKQGDVILSVSLFSLHSLNAYIRVTYIAILTLTVFYGVAEIVLQNFHHRLWEKSSAFLSMGFTIIATIIFLLSQQPYVAFFELWILITKGIVYIKQH